MKYHRDVTHKSMTFGIKQQTFLKLFQETLERKFYEIDAHFLYCFFFIHLLIQIRLR